MTTHSGKDSFTEQVWADVNADSKSAKERKRSRGSRQDSLPRKRSGAKASHPKDAFSSYEASRNSAGSKSRKEYKD